MSATTTQKPWAEFCRYHGSDDFFGCVDKDGCWFDSSEYFAIAVHWCAYHAGEFGLSEHDEVLVAHERGYSIVHSSLLKPMYEAGLIN